MLWMWAKILSNIKIVLKTRLELSPISHTNSFIYSVIHWISVWFSFKQRIKVWINKTKSKQIFNNCILCFEFSLVLFDLNNNNNYIIYKLLLFIKHILTINLIIYFFNLISCWHRAVTCLCFLCVKQNRLCQKKNTG